MKDQAKHIANQRKQLKQQAEAIRELKDKNAGLLSCLSTVENDFKHHLKMDSNSRQQASKLRQDVFFYKSLSASAFCVSLLLTCVLVFGAQQ